MYAIRSYYATAKAIRIAEITLPPDVMSRIVKASENETSPVARREFMHILRNNFV